MHMSEDSCGTYRKLIYAYRAEKRYTRRFKCLRGEIVIDADFCLPTMDVVTSEAVVQQARALLGVERFNSVIEQGLNARAARGIHPGASNTDVQRIDQPKPETDFVHLS